MLGGKPLNTEHNLNEYKHIEPVKQKKRGLAPERNEATCKEVDELSKVGILREVKYRTCVANPVMVKKGGGGWRMILTELFLGCLQGLSSNINGRGRQRQYNFLHRKRSILLLEDALRFENTRATYQRLVDKVFNDQIGRNLKAYVDDMVIKSTFEEDMLMDIQETFDRLRSINMKLNPKKCSFGVEECPFLGHVITKQGIKANPSNVKEIINLKPPRTLKEIQSLNRKLTALNRFLSKGTDRSLPFFKALKSCTDKKTIQWTTDA
ncbi:reverse transcriptase domain-containing protein [Tanacetum coccineum]